MLAKNEKKNIQTVVDGQLGIDCTITNSIELLPELTGKHPRRCARLGKNTSYNEKSPHLN
jgi:hypothetical protein